MKLKNLTQSEWEVMKALWSNSHLTSGQIITEVNKENNWAKTTINSFIQRLLEKNYISFKHDNRYREYYAIKTEKECVVLKMRAINQSIYGRRLVFETKYFEFYGDDDPNFTKVISSSADIGYRRVSDILNYQSDEKLPVHLHKTIKRFHSVMGNPNAPQWFRASFIWGMIHMSPLETFTNLTADKALIHVFTQLCISQINENCPYYLHQGISAYLAQWLDKSRIKDALVKNKENLSLNTLRSFVFNVQNFKSNAGYELSFAFISYIVGKFGLQSLRLMIDDPYNIPKLFNVDENEMIVEFKNYIDNTYLN